MRRRPWHIVLTHYSCPTEFVLLPFWTVFFHVYSSYFRMPRKRRYEEFFNYEDDDVARCRHDDCTHPTMTRKQSNSMTKHLKTHHPDDYRRAMGMEEAGSTKEETTKEVGTETEASGSKELGTAVQSAQPLELFSDDESKAVNQFIL